MSPQQSLDPGASSSASQCPEGFDLSHFFVAAFSLAMLVITGLGGTDYYPSANRFETMLMTCAVLLGALIWAQVVFSVQLA